MIHIWDTLNDSEALNVDRGLVEDLLRDAHFGISFTRQAESLTTFYNDLVLRAISEYYSLADWASKAQVLM